MGAWLDSSDARATQVLEPDASSSVSPVTWRHSRRLLRSLIVVWRSRSWLICAHAKRACNGDFSATPLAVPAQGSRRSAAAICVLRAARRSRDALRRSRPRGRSLGCCSAFLDQRGRLGNYSELRNRGVGSRLWEHRDDHRFQRRGVRLRWASCVNAIARSAVEAVKLCTLRSGLQTISPLPAGHHPGGGRAP